MELQAIRNCAAETLEYFIKVMPDVPFAAGDIIINIVPQSEMAERVKSLCALCAPDKTVSDEQTGRLNYCEAISIIGRRKSAVVTIIDNEMTIQDWHRIFFHEFTHIFCAKLEMEESAHFIDVFGAAAEPKTDDGYLISGYEVWKEFVAHYYALTMPLDRQILTVAESAESIRMLLSEVAVFAADGGKGAFSFACAWLLACSDAEESLSADFLKTLNVRQEFWECMSYLHGHMQKEKPWKISEGFITELWKTFLKFRKANSQ